MKKTDPPKLKHSIPWIGLTGGIAAGKSLVSKFFLEYGIPVIDADSIAHELTAPGGAAQEEVQRLFGTSDRKKLRNLVFNDSESRKKLESILHPLILKESRQCFEIESKKNPPPPFIVYDAALLVETGRHLEMDALIVVDAPSEIRKTRAAMRDTQSTSIIEKIISSQAQDAVRLKMADFILVNESTQDALKIQVKNLIQKIKKRWSLPG